ncbi:hypothetical protein ACTG11_05580 [Aeromonas hydrophila]
MNTQELAAAIKDIAMLRSALAGLIGADTEQNCARWKQSCEPCL